MEWKIPLSDIDFGPEEAALVQEVLQSRWLTMGSITLEFEAEFAQYVGAKHAVAVTNGTAALHLACLVAGLGPGDEVIAPSLTFVATANAIRYVGATPVFADITSQDNLNISPDTIEGLISQRTQAIIVVHYGGYPCEMEEIMRLARNNNLVVIEDAAHAVGAQLCERGLGTWGDVGCFSFFSNKNLTTGEGGMVVTNRDDIADQLRLLRSHGMTSLTWDRHRGHAWSYDVVALGYNYRLDEIRSAIGCAQLAKVERNNERRRYLSLVYRDALQEFAPQVSLPFRFCAGKTSAHLMPIVLPSGAKREVFMQGMKEKGIQTSIHYPPIHSFSAYKDGSAVQLPVTEDVASREVTLPLYPTMTEDHVLEVARTVQYSLSL
jgi:dTDP-4-amino-4,6-dideoxygalactose transaminase